MGKIATLIVASAVASAMTTSAMADYNNMTGFYLGANGGYGVGTTPIISPLGDKVDLGMKGAVGGLQAGFQRDCGQYVMGLEASASLSDTKGTASTQIARNTFKRKEAYGIAARLGPKINCWFVYAKLGYENAKFTDHGAFSVLNVNLVANKSKRLNAFVPGIGFETIFCNHWLIGGEWTYAFYEDKKFFTGAVGNVTVSDKRKPRIGDFKLRLGYKF